METDSESYVPASRAHCVNHSAQKWNPFAMRNPQIKIEQQKIQGTQKD